MKLMKREFGKCCVLTFAMVAGVLTFSFQANAQQDETTTQTTVTTETTTSSKSKSDRDNVASKSTRWYQGRYERK